MKVRMFSVALVGPDGAGKSTVGRALLESSPFPCKVIYVGDNLEACKLALPTSRRFRYSRKRRRDRNKAGAQTGGPLPAKGGSRKLAAADPLGGGTACQIPG